MRSFNKLNKISRQIDVLLGKPPPTFEQFAEKWKEMDELSRSLYELSLCDPDLAGRPKYYERISEYLRRLGVNPEPIDTKSLIESLESDD